MIRRGYRLHTKNLPGRKKNQASTYIAQKNTLAIIYGIFRALILFGLCFLIVMPIIEKISASFMGFDDYRDRTVVYIPKHFTFSNYAYAFELLEYPLTLAVTFVIVFFSALLQVCVCTLAAYGFSRYNFPLKKILFLSVFVVILVPPQTIFGPLYLNFMFFDVFGVIRLITGNTINLIGRSGGYIVLYAFGMGVKSGLYIYMLHQYFRTMPKDLEDAADVDGCGRFRTFAQIVLPDTVPMVVSCFLFSFVWQWTDSLYTSLFLSKLHVISAQLLSLEGRFAEMWQRRYPLEMMPSPQMTVAAGILMCLGPLILIYIFAQRTFVQSISQTGLKM
ncbi:MAG: carbohydrate ABC transporter permease [Treponema sp.]|jgi:multiple sugar transport system permease protein|nr:carbohydrate ABC transporter permease [Treponema sp.]